MTLREERPSADSCGDSFLEKLLPEGCGAEAVFNFSWEKEMGGDGSGGEDDDDGAGGGGHAWTTTLGTVVSTRSLLSINRTTRSTTKAVVGVANRTVTRLPPRFTPSLETRYSSFQQLLRLHMNTFNQRLSMLERNTLDMKESVQRVEEQQKHLSSQLEELIALQAAGAKDKKVKELEKSYSDMEGRLSRLEGRLEILIDGFTALAQEMNRIKRARLSSRSPQETTAVPLLPSSSTPASTFTRAATVLRSIPTPALPTKRPRNTTQLRPSRTSARIQDPTRSGIKAKSRRTGPRTPPAMPKSSTSRPGGRRAAVAKVQPEPPNQGAEAAAGSRRKKAFGSDAPILKTSRRKVLPSPTPGAVVPTTTPKAGSRKPPPAKPKSSTAKRPTAAAKRSATISKASKTTKTSSKSTRARTASKRTASKKPAVAARRKAAPQPQAKRSSVLDLLQLLKGQQKKPADTSLHVVLGRLAIPVRIIPDY